MKLINRYVAEVGKYLSLIKGREDIEKELRSTLEDMLEERAEKAGRPADETMELELLKEYGSPQKIAKTYNPHPYLIGPSIFPFFSMILKITIFGVVIGMSVVTIIELITHISTMGTDYIKIILQGFGNIITISATAAGYVVLAFALIERFVPDLKIDLEQEENWDPITLTKEPDPDAVNRGELIGEIVFTFVGLAILNLYPDILGMYFFIDGERYFIPIFSEVFFSFVPWINLTLFATIGLDIFLLRNALWTQLTRIAKIIIEVASLALTVIILRTPNIFGFSAEDFAKIPASSDAGRIAVSVIEWAVPLALVVAIIVQGIELVKAIYGLLKINYKTK